MREVTRGRPKTNLTQLILEIGSFHGPHHAVRLRPDGRLRYCTDGSQETVAPTVEAWESFWTTMDRIGVWGWKARYDDFETLDGTQWSLELSDGRRRLKCCGSNKYPRQFQALLQAVRALTGRPFG